MQRFKVGDLVRRVIWYSEGNYTPNPIGVVSMVISDYDGYRYEVHFAGHNVTYCHQSSLVSAK